MHSKIDYHTSIHKLGRSSTLFIVGIMFMVPLGITIIYQVELDWSMILAVAAQLCIIFIPTQFAEVLSFTPILGSGGTYLAFITGNISNMKLPAAVSGHKLANVEANSEEGEVVSVLSIGMSSITTTVIVVLGIFVMTPFVHIMQNEVLQPGFNNIMPALVGAMSAPLLKKNPKLAIFPFSLALIIALILGPAVYTSFQGIILLVTMIASVLFVIWIGKYQDKK